MIYFEDLTHTYYNEKKEIYKSVSGIIDLYFPKFEDDKDFWLYYKSLQDVLGIENDEAGKKQYGALLRSFSFFKLKDKNKDQLVQIKNILLGEDCFIDVDKKNNEWKETNIKATTRGSAFHSNMESKFYNEGHTNKEVVSVTTHKEEVKQGLVKAYPLLGTTFGMSGKESKPELVVYNDKYKICGTMDNPIFEYPYVDIDDFKGFSLDTLIPTVGGFIKMEDIKVGDIVYDGAGKETKVKNISKIHFNKCFKLIMDDNNEFICDDEHLWEVSKGINLFNPKVLTTLELFQSKDTYYIISPKEPNSDTYNMLAIKEIVEIPTVATKCIEVESELHTYLVGESYLKTHNTNGKLEFSNKYQKAKAPIAHLDSCNGSKYRIQLSLYAWMLEQYGYKPRNLTITHVIFLDDKPQYTVEHKVEYLKKEVENILEHYASTYLKING